MCLWSETVTILEIDIWIHQNNTTQTWDTQQIKLPDAQTVFYMRSWGFFHFCIFKLYFYWQSDLVLKNASNRTVLLRITVNRSMENQINEMKETIVGLFITTWLDEVYIKSTFNFCWISADVIVIIDALILMLRLLRLNELRSICPSHYNELCFYDI